MGNIDTCLLLEFVILLYKIWQSPLAILVSHHQEGEHDFQYWIMDSQAAVKS